jgi:outer membrane protein
MKTRIFAILVLGLALVAGEAVSAEVSVAVVNPLRLQSEAPQVASVSERIRREFADREKKIIEQQQQVQQLEDKLQRDQEQMAVEEAKSLQRDIRSRNLRMENAREELESDRRLRLNEEMDRLRRVLAEVIAEVAKAEGIDIVLESGFTWASERADITDKVLVRMRELNAEGR